MTNFTAEVVLSKAIYIGFQSFYYILFINPFIYNSSIKKKKNRFFFFVQLVVQDIQFLLKYDNEKQISTLEKLGPAEFWGVRVEHILTIFI